MYQQEITIDHLGIYYIYLIDSNVGKLTIAKAKSKKCYFRNFN